MSGVAKKRRVRPLLERFEGRVSPEPNTGCWLWMGCVDQQGYGRINAGGRGGKMLKTHRVAWALYRGPVPDGLCVLHRCDCPGCVNPDHLFLGTNADNMSDMTAKGRGVQPRGEAHGRATLTDALVREARRLRSEGLNFAAVGRRIGISRGQAHKVCAGHSWTHVPLADEALEVGLPSGVGR